MSGTVEELEGSLGRHPILWTVGALMAAGLVAYYYLSGSKSGSGSASSAYNFSYSVGPTAAQVAAGTAQQNQVQADQTAVSLANIAATSSNTQAGDYFSYLTSNSANALSENATNDSTLTTLGINGQNDQVLESVQAAGASINASNDQVLEAVQAATVAINGQNDQQIEMDR